MSCCRWSSRWSSNNSPRSLRSTPRLVDVFGDGGVVDVVLGDLDQFGLDALLGRLAGERVHRLLHAEPADLTRFLADQALDGAGPQGLDLGGAGVELHQLDGADLVG